MFSRQPPGSGSVGGVQRPFGLPRAPLTGAARNPSGAGPLLPLRTRAGETARGPPDLPTGSAPPPRLPSGPAHQAGVVPLGAAQAVSRLARPSAESSALPRIRTTTSSATGPVPTSLARVPSASVRGTRPPILSAVTAGSPAVPAPVPIRVPSAIRRIPSSSPTAARPTSLSAYAQLQTRAQRQTHAQQESQAHAQLSTRHLAAPPARLPRVAAHAALAHPPTAGRRLVPSAALATAPTTSNNSLSRGGTVAAAGAAAPASGAPASNLAAARERASARARALASNTGPSSSAAPAPAPALAAAAVASAAASARVPVAPAGRAPVASAPRRPQTLVPAAAASQAPAPAVAPVRAHAALLGPPTPTAPPPEQQEREQREQAALRAQHQQRQRGIFFEFHSRLAQAQQEGLQRQQNERDAQDQREVHQPQSAAATASPESREIRRVAVADPANGLYASSQQSGGPSAGAGASAAVVRVPAPDSPHGRGSASSGSDGGGSDSDSDVSEEHGSDLLRFWDNGWGHGGNDRVPRARAGPGAADRERDRERERARAQSQQRAQAQAREDEEQAQILSEAAAATAQIVGESRAAVPDGGGGGGGGGGELMSLVSQQRRAETRLERADALLLRIGERVSANEALPLRSQARRAELELLQRRLRREADRLTQEMRLTELDRQMALVRLMSAATGNAAGGRGAAAQAAAAVAADAGSGDEHASQAGTGAGAAADGAGVRARSGFPGALPVSQLGAGARFPSLAVVADHTGARVMMLVVPRAVLAEPPAGADVADGAGAGAVAGPQEPGSPMVGSPALLRALGGPRGVRALVELASGGSFDADAGPREPLNADGARFSDGVLVTPDAVAIPLFPPAAANGVQSGPIAFGAGANPNSGGAVVAGMLGVLLAAVMQAGIVPSNEQVGLSPAELAKLLRLSYAAHKHGRTAGARGADEDIDDCPICLAAFTDEDEVVTPLACKHTVHWGCGENWWRRSTVCPMCKRHVITGDSNHASNPAGNRAM